MPNRRALRVALLLTPIFLLLSLAASAWQVEQPRGDSKEKVIYFDQLSDVIEVTISVDTLSEGCSSAIATVYLYGDDEPQENEWTKSSLGSPFTVAGCVSKVTVKVPPPATGQYKAHTAAGSLKTVYRRPCERRVRDEESGMAPGELEEGVAFVASAGDQLLVNITQWVTRDQAASLFSCLCLDIPECFSILVPQLVGVTFPFDLFAWCHSVAGASSLTLLDSAGNQVTGCTTSDEIFIQVIDLSHLGTSVLSKTVTVAGLTVDLAAVPGAVGTFISGPIRLEDLDMQPGDSIAVSYTDPENPLDIATLVFGICPNE